MGHKGDYAHRGGLHHGPRSRDSHVRLRALYVVLATTLIWLLRRMATGAPDDLYDDETLRSKRRAATEGGAYVS